MATFVKCTYKTLGSNDTKLFTIGNLYKVVDVNFNNSVTIKDNLGHERCIGTDFKFPIQGHLGIMKNHYVKFEEC